MPGQLPPQSVLSRPAAGSRSGTITLWTILFLPVLVLLLLVVVEGIHFWLARVELENALEAAALAAVKEWAESGNTPAQNWTQGARLLGLEYGNANTIRNVNFNPANFAIEDNLGVFSNPGNPNENAICEADGVANPPLEREGTLIFGAIIDDDPLTFTTEEIPSCLGEGTVLFDVTSGEEGGLAADGSWGISFRTDPDPFVNANLLIDRIEINLDPDNQDNLRFNFTTLGPQLSDSSPQPKVAGVDQTGTASSQYDNYGWVGWTATTGPGNEAVDPDVGAWPGIDGHSSPQITFSPAVGNPEVLTITFSSYMGDNGFSPGDRFRFGADVERRNPGGNWNQADGDDIGDLGVEVTIYFKNLGDPEPPPGSGVSANFRVTENSKNQCGDDNRNRGVWYQDDLGNHHILVHPERPLGPFPPPPGPSVATDLPCPSTSSATNDKQSYVETSGSGVRRDYAVRAQARIEVPPLCSGFCGFSPGPYRIYACATAVYDCELARPRLIRPEVYICVVP